MSRKIGEQPRQTDFFHTCINCPSICCIGARPPLTSRRRALIRDYLTTNGITIEDPFEESTYSFPRETKHRHCIFLDKHTKKCRIHAVKPETCVAGPVTFDINLKTGCIEWFLKAEKICPLAGALYKDKGALKNHLESARKELLQLVHDLDAYALRAILRIEEPDIFKIGEEELDTKVLTKLKPPVWRQLKK